MDEVLIIGAGPAGLATAARLRKAQIPFRILDKGRHVAERWHHHYDRVHLHTVKKYSHLPYMEFPEDYPTYVSRDALIKYLEEYANAFDITPDFGVTVQSIEKGEDGKWEVRTDDELIRSWAVVIATGVNNKPVIPAWADSVAFDGDIIHSIDYKNPEPFLGERVLVVGMGNTGAEIALDLAEHGIPVRLSVRGEVNLVPRDLNGRPVQETGKFLAKLPFGIGDWIGARARDIYFGDLTPYGIRYSRVPPAVQLRRTGKTPVIDIGTIAAIKEGRINVVGEVETLFPLGAHILNDGWIEVEHIILATGYKPCIEDLVERMPEFLDDHGYPEGPVGKGFHEGLYFVGFNNYEVGGILGTIYHDSRVIVEHMMSLAQTSKDQEP